MGFFFDWNWGDQCVWGEKRITTEGQISTTFLEISEIQEKKSLNAQKTNNFLSQFSYLWSANTVTCLLMSIICIWDTIISSTHTFMSGPSVNILTYFPYIRSPLTNILRTYCDMRSVFFIISRAFVDMYSARFIMCCQNFVICGSFSYRLALRSLRLTACGP